jgi:hypothetical protein
MFNPDLVTDFYGGKMVSLATASDNLNVFWTGATLKIVDNADASVLYNAVPSAEIFEILDVAVENVAANALADVTVLYVKKTDVETGSFGNRTYAKTTTYSVVRKVFADLIRLNA